MNEFFLVALFGQCSDHHDCAGSGTECLTGYCVCQDGYHAQDTLCSEYFSLLNNCHTIMCYTMDMINVWNALNLHCDTSEYCGMHTSCSVLIYIFRLKLVCIHISACNFFL